MRIIKQKRVSIIVLLISLMISLNSWAIIDTIHANPIPPYPFIELSDENSKSISSEELSNNQQISWNMMVDPTSNSEVRFLLALPLCNGLSWTPNPPSNFTLAPGESIQINTTLNFWRGTIPLRYDCKLVNTSSSAIVFYHYTILNGQGVPGFNSAIWVFASITIVVSLAIIRKRSK